MEVIQLPNDSRQIGATVDSELWEQFREHVEEEHGTVRGNLSRELNQALKHYLEGSGGNTESEILGRLERIEAAIAGEGGGAPLSPESGQKKKKTQDNMPVTERRKREIYQELQTKVAEKSGAKTHIPEEEFRAVVGSHAGQSEPTVRQYKDLLRREDKIHPHPVKDGWLLDSEEWVNMVHSLRNQGALSRDDYELFVEQFGTEEFQNTLLSGQEVSDSE